MKMKADWDNPFPQKKRLVFGSLSLDSTSTQLQVDAERIKQDQQKLLPLFQDLYEASSQILGHSKSLSQETRVIMSVLYRMPDSPHILNRLDIETSTHVVPLIEDEIETYHPLVETICPSKPQTSLTAEERQSLLALDIYGSNHFLSADQNSPQHIRLALPEVIHFVMHWIQNLDGPIKSFRYLPLSPTNSRHAQNGTQFRIG